MASLAVDSRILSGMSLPSTRAEALFLFGAALQHASTSQNRLVDAFVRQPLENLLIEIVEEAKKRAEANLSAIDRVAQLYLLIEEVKEVRVQVLEKRTLFHVFADMPEYNDALMDALIEAEVEADDIAEDAGRSFEYRYYPLPQVTPESAGLHNLPRRYPS